MKINLSQIMKLCKTPKNRSRVKNRLPKKAPQEVSLSSICSSLQKLPQAIKNQTVSPSLKQAFRNHMPLAEEFINQKTAELNSLGWSLNIRASGTEELVRITIWGDDPDKINQKALAIAADLQALESSLQLTQFYYLIVKEKYDQDYCSYRI